MRSIQSSLLTSIHPVTIAMSTVAEFIITKAMLRADNAPRLIRG
jgi:hypothetical protein